MEITKKILHLLILVFALSGSLAATAKSGEFVDRKYLGQRNSLIDWKSINTEIWLDYRTWFLRSAAKDKNSEWQTQFRETNLKEVIGRVISCVNRCRVFRGEGFFNPSYTTKLKEGDEFVTLADSYAWIYLMDGTIVRVAAESSISLKEINIGRESNFLHVRLNDGNISWISRSSSEFTERDLPETDPIFLPVSLMEANKSYYQHMATKVSNDRELLKSAIAPDKTVAQHYRRVNSLIEKNNSFVKNKPTYSFIVLANGTIYGKNIDMDLFHETGHSSYFKRRRGSDFYKDSNDLASEVKFYGRGYVNRNVRHLSVGKWYIVDEKGKNFDEFDTAEYSELGQIITSRVPTILMVRELFLKKYSQYLFRKNIEAEKLAVNYGYRLWDEPDRKKGGLSEQQRRLRFLLEYTRRIETSNLFSAEKLRKGTIYRKTKEMVYFDPKYYREAATLYLNSLSHGASSKEHRQSEMKRLGFHFWLIKNAAGR